MEQSESTGGLRDSGEKFPVRGSGEGLAGAVEEAETPCDQLASDQGGKSVAWGGGWHSPLVETLSVWTSNSEHKVLLNECMVGGGTTV